MELLAEFDRRGGHVGIGLASCAHWLSWRCGIGLVAAREKVRVARALAGLPRVAEAMRRGVLSYCKVRALTRIATVENEGLLLSVAEAGTVSHVEKVVRLYRRAACAEELEQANECFAQRYLQCYVDETGEVVVRGRLAPEQGAVFMKALRGAADELRDAERDSREAWDARDVVDAHGARNADALGLLAEGFLAHGARDVSGPDRQLLTIHVDQAVLRDEAAEGRCELEDQSLIPPASALRRLESHAAKLYPGTSASRFVDVRAAGSSAVGVAGVSGAGSSSNPGTARSTAGTGPASTPPAAGATGTRGDAGASGSAGKPAAGSGGWSTPAAGSGGLPGLAGDCEVEVFHDRGRIARGENLSRRTLRQLGGANCRSSK